MRPARFLLPWLMLFVCGSFLPARGEDAPAAVRELRLDPATTSVFVGKATLTVEPLVRGGGGLRADYKVVVSRLPFGDEAGKLTVTISDDALRQLAAGHSIEFTGQAVSTEGNTSAVQGTAKPTDWSKETGAIHVRIEGKKGTLVFRTTYHLVK